MAFQSDRRREESQKTGTSSKRIKLWNRSVFTLDLFPRYREPGHLHPEYEVRDMSNGYRYLDLSYMPGGSKACIEIQDYRCHARDVEPGRFKDLCLKQALLSLDGWLFLPIAYLSITDAPGVCKQLTLAFVVKFLSTGIPSELNRIEAETLRFARRFVRSFTPRELSSHPRLSERHIREHLRHPDSKKLLIAASGTGDIVRINLDNNRIFSDYLTAATAFISSYFKVLKF